MGGGEIRTPLFCQEEGTAPRTSKFLAFRGFS